MTDVYTTKPKLKSTTFQGAILMVISFAFRLLGLLGVDLPESMDTEFVNTLAMTMQGVLDLVAMAMVIIGRFKASQPLKTGLLKGWL